MQNHMLSSALRSEREPGKNPNPNPEQNEGSDESPRRRMPPDSIPNPLPGVDPQQTPGIDHLPAEWD
ncbi:hypothetical protein [Pusillimonas sp.]|uniref:hypothetical protein n=1 Tax=Pusillimonas sp. TaxID=3040095 RepID=UPI0037C50172